jgi:hypothetical protein
MEREKASGNLFGDWQVVSFILSLSSLITVQGLRSQIVD